MIGDLLAGGGSPAVTAAQGATQMLGGGTSSAHSGGDVHQGGHVFNFAPPAKVAQAQSWERMAPWIAVVVAVVVFLLVKKK